MLGALSTAVFLANLMQIGSQIQVKALQIIWNKFPNYSAQNTIHVDDLGRNFLMNQGNGLRVKAYTVSQSSSFFTI